MQIIRGGFSLMLRHRLHCKIERAETETYLTGTIWLQDAILLATLFFAHCCHVRLPIYCIAAAALSLNHSAVDAGHLRPLTACLSIGH